MNDHRYILEPYKGMKTRYRCPGCDDKEKTFARYIDAETSEHIHPDVGRCNRESNCGYHYTPKQYFVENGNKGILDITTRTHRPNEILKQKPVSFIPANVFKASLKGHEINHFVRYLIYLFGVAVTGQLISRYFIGTSKHWSGATVFWQIDETGKIRTGKIMQYNPTTGKRVKEPFNHIHWVHSVLKQPDFELKQCLFGEHLLIDKRKPVAIVESEKTAVIASTYLPQFIWLAVGSLTNLTAEKCHVLKGRTVALFPDLNGFEKWSNKAKELSKFCSVQVSDLLERKATPDERKKGFDLADYLIQFDYRIFQLSETKEQDLQPTAEVITTEQIEPVYNFSHSDNWVQDIAELEKYFSEITLPDMPVQLNQCSMITNAHSFIENHFATVKANSGNRTFLPYLSRLHELKTVLINVP